MAADALVPAPPGGRGAPAAAPAAAGNKEPAAAAPGTGVTVLASGAGGGGHAVDVRLPAGVDAGDPAAVEAAVARELAAFVAWRDGPAAADPARQAAVDATAWREAGNRAFRRADFAGAVRCYTRGLRHRPTPQLLGNRAQARLQLREFALAARDCDLALRLDPGFAKALARRATARAALGAPAAAAADLRAALAVAPRPDRGPLRARLRDLEGE